MASDGTPECAGYIRGAGGANVSGRNVARVAVGFWLALLGCLAIVLAVQGVHQTSRDHRLQRQGVPVEVTVTSCFGRAAGTGVTPTGFSCTGTFSLDGRRYSDLIGGTSSLLARGSTLRAVTDPNHRSILATTSAVATTKPSWKNFVSAAIVFLVLLLSAALARWRLTRVDRGGLAGAVDSEPAAAAR